MERIENTILCNLIYNEEYSRKVIPFIQPEYFENRIEKILFEEIVKFIVKYESNISIEVLKIETENRTDVTETDLLNSEEVWCTSSTNYCVPITEIDGKKIGDGSVGGFAYKSYDLISTFISSL